MEKLMKNIDKELQEIAEQGLNTSNIQLASTLSEIKKNIAKAKYYEEGDEEGMRNYREYDDYRGDYGRRYRDGGYDEGGYGRRYREGDDYGRRSRDSRGRYREGGYGHGPMGKFDDIMERLSETVEEYEFMKGRYHDGGSEQRMHEGLEKLMYSICMFIESAMNFAESPEEKEIIRKHIKKLENI